MAISVVNLGASSGTTAVNPDLRDIGEAASYSNTAWTPNANKLIGCWQMARRAAGAVTPTMTGNGVTWTAFTTTTFEAGARNLTLFATLTGGSPANGANTWDFGGIVMLNCYSLFFEIDGYDTGLAIGDLIVVTGASGTATSGSVSDIGAAADDRHVSCFAHDANELTTHRQAPDPVWTEMDDVNGAGPGSGMNTQFKTDAQDLTASASWTTSSAWGGQIARIKAPSALVVRGLGPIMVPSLEQAAAIHRSRSW